MTDNLQTRIARAIYNDLARAIYNACDEYTRKLLVRPDCPGASELDGDGMPVCFMLAEDVIRELAMRQEWRAAGNSCVGPQDCPEDARLYGKAIESRYVTDWKAAE